MRLFIAAHFPAEVLTVLGEKVARLKPRLPPASWVRTESQHLTFAFLGEQPEPLVPKISAPLAARIAAVPRFEACLKGCGFFPNPRHPRVGWIGITPEEPFNELARAVREVVTTSGVTLDRSDFKAHLTLLRTREGWPPASVELFSKTLRDFESTPFVVDSITLFNSQLNPSGAIHTPLQRYPLA